MSNSRERRRHAAEQHNAEIEKQAEDKANRSLEPPQKYSKELVSWLVTAAVLRLNTQEG